MKVIEDIKKETINKVVENVVVKESSFYTDGSNSYVEISDFVSNHQSEVIPPRRLERSCLGFILLLVMQKDNY